MAESTNTQTTRDQPARILIVEDDRDLNNLLKFTLESTRDYEVASHFDGKDAVEIMLSWKPHLVLLDTRKWFTWRRHRDASFVEDFADECNACPPNRSGQSGK